MLEHHQNEENLGKRIFLQEKQLLALMEKEGVLFYLFPDEHDEE